MHALGEVPRTNGNAGVSKIRSLTSSEYDPQPFRKIRVHDVLCSWFLPSILRQGKQNLKREVAEITKEQNFVSFS